MNKHESNCAQQVSLDNALVALEKRLKIEKCNARIEFSKPQREVTYQVTLDALKLSPCYPAFLINAEICLILPNQDFVEPPSEDEMVLFIQELGYSGKCDMLSAIHTDQMHQPGEDLLLSSIGASLGRQQDLIGSENQELKSCGKARKFKKVASPLKKLSLVLEEEPAVKLKRAKNAKKSTIVPTVVLLLETLLLKKTFKKSKLETHKLHASGSGDGVGSQPKVPDESEDKTTGMDKGTGTKPGVPDVPKYQSESENESWGDGDDDRNDDESDDDSNDDDDDDDDVDSDADGDNEASDNEKTNSDKDDNPNLNQNDDEEEEYEEEYVHTLDNYEFTDDDEEYEELYKDVNVRLKDTEHKEEEKGDAEMTDVGRDDGTQQTTYEQVKDDEHVILIIVHDTQKTEVQLKSSSVSSDFAN
ncbi:hypothetical protein Tco_1291128 [Tanacetum coccineum]